MAPEILVQVALSGDDCHWKVMPDATVKPVSVSVKVVPGLPDVGERFVVPAVGEPEQEGMVVIVTK